MKIGTHFSHCFSHVNTTYVFANNYAKNRDENNQVPRILHFLWIFQPIPEKYLTAISGFEKNNPDYEVNMLYCQSFFDWSCHCQYFVLIDLLVE